MKQTTIKIAKTIAAFWLISCMMMTAELLQAQPSASDYAKTIYGQDVQKVINQAPPYSTIVGDDVERMRPLL